jgi:hypothetical protein
VDQKSVVSVVTNWKHKKPGTVQSKTVVCTVTKGKQIQEAGNNGPEVSCFHGNELETLETRNKETKDGYIRRQLFR